MNRRSVRHRPLWYRVCHTTIEHLQHTYLYFYLVMCTVPGTRLFLRTFVCVLNVSLRQL